METYGQNIREDHHSNQETEPKVILLLNTYNIDTIRYRKNKKALFRQFINNLLEGLATELQSNPTLRPKFFTFKTNNECNNDSCIRSLMTQRTSYAISLTYFDVYFSQNHVEVEKSTTGSKSKEAYYDLTADMRFSIYKKDSTVEEIAIKENKKHSSRPVVSGLLSTGPNIVSRREDAWNFVHLLIISYANQFVKAIK